MTILHVFSDEKFIDRHMKVFESGNFHNECAILKKHHTYAGKFRHQITHIYPNNKAYIELCKRKESYKIVIVYFLDENKIRLINDIKNSNTKVLWWFYGAEIYSLPKLKYQFLSEETQKLLGFINFGINTNNIKSKLKNIVLKFLVRKSFNEQIHDVVKKIDYFVWYNKFEYNFLNSKLGNILPPFLQAVFSDNIGDVSLPNRRNEMTIMVGNSRSPFNNHVNILKLLEKTSYNENVIIPFSYGTNNRYVERLKLESKKYKLKIVFMEDYVTFEEYVDTVSKCSAMIFNSYRQMALGNIFIGIRCGLKIYLNEKNPVYSWLISMGFSVSSIQKDLEINLINKNLQIDEKSAQINLLLYRKLMSTTHNQEFLKKLVSL